MGTDPNPPGGRGRMQAQRTPGGLPVAGGSGMARDVSEGSETSRRRNRSLPRVPTPDPPEARWLPQALRELEEVGEGVEVDGPTPSGEVVAEARSLLRQLASWADDAPAVDDDADGGVSVEFYGRKGCRLLLIVESDGSAIYQELVAGEVVTERFATWRQLLEAFGRPALRRVGVPVRGELEVRG